jgi:hypothetical protein
MISTWIETSNEEDRRQLDGHKRKLGLVSDEEFLRYAYNLAVAAAIVKDRGAELGAVGSDAKVRGLLEQDKNEPSKIVFVDPPVVAEVPKASPRKAKAAPASPQ